MRCPDCNKELEEMRGYASDYCEHANECDHLCGNFSTAWYCSRCDEYIIDCDNYNEFE